MPGIATASLPEAVSRPPRSAWDALRDALRASRPDGERSLPLFAWESPEGESLAALGIAAEWHGPDAPPGSMAYAGVARLLGRGNPARENGAEPLRSARRSPIAFGGFPFAAGATARPGFAGARFFLPLRAWRVAPNGETSEWSTPHTDGAERSTASARRGGATFDHPSNDDSPPAAGAGDGSFDRAGWVDAVHEALVRIREGSLEKAVLARSIVLESPRPFDALHLFETLRIEQPGTYRFLFRDAAGFAFVGASPERLVRLAGDAAESEAVAGTIRRGDDAAEDARLGASLLASDKDRREHAAVAREIHDALEALCDRVEADPEPRLLALHHLIHLRTRIRAVPRPGTHVFELLARLHPTPAVAGSPREAALAWIRRMEPCARGWYSGPVGWVTADGEGDFAVGIRSATLCGRRARVFAGAGIVAGSDPDAEWLETELKMRSMRDVLENA